MKNLNDFTLYLADSKDPNQIVAIGDIDRTFIIIFDDSAVSDEIKASFKNTYVTNWKFNVRLTPLVDINGITITFDLIEGFSALSLMNNPSSHGTLMKMCISPLSFWRNYVYSLTVNYRNEIANYYSSFITDTTRDITDTAMELRKIKAFRMFNILGDLALFKQTVGPNFDYNALVDENLFAALGPRILNLLFGKVKAKTNVVWSEMPLTSSQLYTTPALIEWVKAHFEYTVIEGVYE